MEQEKPKPMTPFDTLTTPSWLYTLKLLLPYAPSSIQHFLAIYIKFSELTYTINHFRSFTKTRSNIHIFEDLGTYMTTEEKEKMEQMEGMMNMMEMVQNMQSASDPMFQAASEEGHGLNPMDLMKGMLSPEQQEMFDMYSSMFDTEMNNGNMPDDQEGDLKHERMDE